MCVICAIPAKKWVTEEQLVRATESNPDGFGWSVLVRRREMVSGWDLDPDRAIDRFMTLRDAHIGQPAMFHARIATHGHVKLENCHPFPVGGDKRVMLAHNGILPCEPGPFDHRSDTGVLCDDIIPRSGIDTLWTHTATWERWIGTNNKLVILSSLPKRQHLLIIGAERGEWANGVWWSNNSYRWSPYRYKSGPYVPGTTYAVSDGKLTPVGPNSETDERKASREFPGLTALARGASEPCDICKGFGATKGSDGLLMCETCRAELLGNVTESESNTETYCEACNGWYPIDQLEYSQSGEFVCQDCLGAA